MSCSDRYRNAPIGVPVIERSESLPEVIQKRTARGNSLSITRKSTTSGGVMRPYLFRYISKPLTDLSTADQWMSSYGVPMSNADGSSMKYFTSRMRDVLSARSSIRPRRMKCHASL